LARAGATRARWLGVGATLIASAWLGGCSGAGSGPDSSPFAASGSGGGVSAVAGTGNVTPAASAGTGGGSGLADGPGNLIDDNSASTEEQTPVSVFPESPSCAGGEPDACSDESCCTRKPVTTADLMTVAQNTTVTLSPYTLDKFEVTVGRFRTFLETYDDWRTSGNPEAGAGAHPYTPGSGWVKDASWEVELAGNAAVMRIGLKCNATQQTWTDEPGFNELKPINCVSWYEASAFCAWDEGRLPSEAEWQYAAVGGAQARTFAWGNTPLGPTFASYACEAAGTAATCSADDIPDVGSRQDGNGLFGQADLTGSVYEWTLDWYAPYPETMRDDYAKTDTGTERVLRGGAWNSTTTAAMGSTDRSFRRPPTFRSPTTGIRCARVSDDLIH
jgi:formylglycine-generating enzyme required for sulfatase activity